MWIYISKSHLLNHVYHSWQAYEKPLYLHLITFSKHSTFLGCKWCHFTFKEYYCITFVQFFTYNVSKWKRTYCRLFWPALQHSICTDLWRYPTTCIFTTISRLVLLVHSPLYNFHVFVLYQFALYSLILYDPAPCTVPCGYMNACLAPFPTVTQI